MFEPWCDRTLTLKPNIVISGETHITQPITLTLTLTLTLTFPSIFGFDRIRKTKLDSSTCPLPSAQTCLTGMGLSHQYHSIAAVVSLLRVPFGGGRDPLAVSQMDDLLY